MTSATGSGHRFVDLGEHESAWRTGELADVRGGGRRLMGSAVRFSTALMCGRARRAATPDTASPWDWRTVPGRGGRRPRPPPPGRDEIAGPPRVAWRYGYSSRRSTRQCLVGLDQAGCGPSRIATATARLSATTGPGRMSSRASYSPTIWSQSVSAASAASACTAAIAAWVWYWPGHPPPQCPGEHLDPSAIMV